MNSPRFRCAFEHAATLHAAGLRRGAKILCVQGLAVAAPAEDNSRGRPPAAGAVRWFRGAVSGESGYLTVGCSRTETNRIQ